MVVVVIQVVVIVKQKQLVVVQKIDELFENIQWFRDHMEQFVKKTLNHAQNSTLNEKNLRKQLIVENDM